ncbi:SDR family NAD(P)-dependent oxidoreductase [Lentibacillus populi]|uniref:SDR family NAD(P)-dependent oxidoreductase n=1 Tax=Lentibacillus populi TaxID=1827502 RepID=UPI003530AE46
MSVETNVRNKSIIITGASSGIGERIAWHIAENGGTPIMIARSIDKLENLKEKLQRSFDITAHVYQADITDRDAFSNVIQQILLEHKNIHGLINNAGAGVFDYVEDIKMEDIERMFQLNVYALIQGTQLLLPHFSANRRKCHIVNIASQAGKIATPKSAVYAATKHAVLGFTNALRMEVAGKGIYVTAVNLGPVKTNFFKTADPSGSYQKSVSRYMLDPDKTARKVVKNLFRKKREINLPHWMEAGSKFYQLFPGVMEVLLRKQFNRK